MLKTSRYSNLRHHCQNSANFPPSLSILNHLKKKKKKKKHNPVGITPHWWY